MVLSLRQWNCSLLHFPLAQFYFPRACLDSCALCGHCPGSESSLWSSAKLVSQLWSPGLNLLPAPTLSPQPTVLIEKSKSSPRREKCWLVAKYSQEGFKESMSEQIKKENQEGEATSVPPQGGVLSTTVILFFTVVGVGKT